MPIEKGGREPKMSGTAELIAELLAGRLGHAEPEPRRRPVGKTTGSMDVAGLLAARGDNRVLLVDVDPAPSATMEDIERLLDELGQGYDPVLLDCPPSLNSPVSGEAWEGARRALGLDTGDDPTAPTA